MGGRVNLVNDIQILQDILNSDIQVVLQSGQGRPSVQLTDSQSGATVEIKGLPPNSIVIKAEDFENPLTVFNGSKGECKRADFVIVSNDEKERKWIICIETQESNSKNAWHIIQQLKGAYCFINYCQCIGKSFWELEEFLDDYNYRFVSIVDINPSPNKQPTQLFDRAEKLHDRPDIFKKISQRYTIHFSKLIHPDP